MAWELALMWFIMGANFVKNVPFPILFEILHFFRISKYLSHSWLMEMYTHYILNFFKICTSYRFLDNLVYPQILYMYYMMAVNGKKVFHGCQTRQGRRSV